MTITEFLLARISEDEAVARGAVDQWRHGSWRDYAMGIFPVGEEYHYVVEYVNHEGIGAHIARHDPARVLAGCEAKRRIVELHSGETASNDPQCRHIADEWPCPTLLALVSVYAGHPDHDPAWTL